MGFLARKLRYQPPKPDANRRSISCEYATWNCVKVLQRRYGFVTPGRPASSKVDDEKSLEKMVEWCKTEIEGRWFLNSNRFFYFENKDDAIMFKLVNF